MDECIALYGRSLNVIYFCFIRNKFHIHQISISSFSLSFFECFKAYVHHLIGLQYLQQISNTFSIEARLHNLGLREILHETTF